MHLCNNTDESQKQPKMTLYDYTHTYETFKMNKSIETESRFMVVRGRSWGRDEQCLLLAIGLL